LPANYVLHAVAPKWHEEDDQAQSLLKTYERILTVADALGLKTISIPAISTGINGYPKQFAADVALEGLVELLPNFKNLESALVVCADTESAQAYNRKANEIQSDDVQIINLFPSVLCDT
jgi:O-acetyl-ADP-ribose deacetylase